MRAWIPGMLPFLVVVQGRGPILIFVALVSLLGASAASADVEYDPNVPDDRKAIGITNLEVEGAFYDVTFPEQRTAQEVYGDPPGVYDIFPRDSAIAAVKAVNAALNAEPMIPFWVGVEGGATDESTQVFAVGYASHIPMIGPEVRVLDAWNGENLAFGQWNDNEPIEIPAYAIDQRTFAVFTPVAASVPSLSPLGLGLLIITLMTVGIIWYRRNQAVR